jgi:hypothetical protein
MIDTVTYVLVASAHSKRGKSISCQKDSVSQQAEVSLPGVFERHRQLDGLLPRVPVVAPIPYSDLAFLEQIVRVVVAGMAEAFSLALKPERVVTLVLWVKRMREMGCVTLSGEEDAEVAVHWLRKVEKVMT